MTERIRGARALGEGTIIVCSILLAFFVDAMWERHQDSVLERQYLARLISEVDEHAGEAEFLAGFQATVRDDALATYDRLASGQLGEVDAYQGLMDAYDATRTLRPEFTDDVYQELLATGNLRLFANPAVRGGITSYYESMAAPPQFEMASLAYRDLVRGLIPPRTKLVIRACRRRSASDCDWQISEDEARDILRRLAAAPGVLEGASHVVEQWDRGATYLTEMVGRASEMSALLAGELGD